VALRGVRGAVAEERDNLLFDQPGAEPSAICQLIRYKLRALRETAEYVRS